MNKYLTKTLMITGSILLAGGVISLPFSLLSINSNSIVIGNFQSYMSPTLMNSLNKDYDINWQYYSSNAEIPTYIQNKTLDIAIATNNMVGQLIVQNSIQKIEWEKFNIKTPSGTTVKKYLDLKEIVTPATWSLCEIIGQQIGIENLLEYCIPYFSQDLVFGYNGPIITDFNSKPNCNFNNIFSYITDTSIPNNRFLENNSSVMMIKDARTVFDICNLIEGKNINPQNAIISIDNKNNNSSPTIDEMNEVYNSIYNNYYSGISNKNIITFNSDSNVVLNKFANNEINGAFFYNGDAIYSLMGGDSISISDEYTDQQIEEWTNNKHVIIPEQNFIAMDAFVINKTLDSSKKDQVYNIIKSISLDFDNMLNVDQEGNYLSMTMQNFDYINYTPCYSQLYDYVTTTYFKECFPNNPNLSSLLEEIIKIDESKISQNNLELPINNLAESNMNIAFTTFIDKI